MADDLGDWEFREPEPDRWVHIARCGNASVYLHLDAGTVAVTSADEMKAGGDKLRRLADDLPEFFHRYVFGPEYPLIEMNPSQMTVHLDDQDGWLALLETAGCFEHQALVQLKTQWDRQLSRPTYTPPKAWIEAEPSDSELEFKRRLALLTKAADRLKPAKFEQWDLALMSIGHYKGAPMAIKPQLPQDLWRLYRMQSMSAYGVLQFGSDGMIYERSDQLAKTFKSCGVDPGESDRWLAIALYHGKATLLLHRETGEVAGLEPAPANRLRSFGSDLFAFVNEFGIGPRHGELCFSERDRRQARNARQWLEFLQANDLI
ncbi:hypothetical protein [Glycomyces buryatensis]|uniref:SMI1/KNR4 family protein n=1 Tax=Glycomyces buryatensis TaxID=2570927 RepID=A0A4S8Q9W7_9ACTN|nr:hypothetical protein [Glycomyces buryatensis]THV37749.1 hypothetical protein FAB82_20105 [Glycomyces buryatensis]